MATSGVNPQSGAPYAQVISNTANPGDPANQNAAAPTATADSYRNSSEEAQIARNFDLLDAKQIGRLDDAVAAAGGTDGWAGSMKAALHPGADGNTNSRLGLIDTFITSLDQLGKSKRAGDRQGAESLAQVADMQARQLGVADAGQRRELIDGTAAHGELGPYPAAT